MAVRGFAAAERAPGWGRALLTLALVSTASLAIPGGGQARPSTQCSAKTSCPDLFLSTKLVSARLSADQLTVEVIAEVVNEGTAESSTTTVSVSAQGWEATSASLRPLKAGGDKDQVNATLQVPDSARGRRTSFAVQVDPNDAVNETNETNNEASTSAVFIPAGDLQVALNGSALSDSGRTLVLNATVSNTGQGVTAATVLTVASPASGWSGTADVPALGAGESTPVDLSLPIPDSARGKTWPFSVVVDPKDDVSETSSEDNVSNSLEVPIDAGDLTVAIAGARPASDGTSVSFTVHATNIGAAPTAATSVQAAVRDSSAKSVEIGSLDAGAGADVPVTLPLLPAAPGTTVTLLATVDPSHDVAESSYGNNAAEPVFVDVPKPAGTTTTTPTPRGSPPDLVVSIVVAVVRGDPELTALLAVRNTGGERSAPTRVVLSVAGLSLSAAARVPPVAPGRSFRLPVSRSVPDSVRGRRLELAAVVDPSRDIRESSYSDNVSVPFAFVVPGPAPSPWRKWLGIGSAIVAALLAFGYGAIRYRLRLRIRWQSEARDEEPPERCHAKESYVWRRHCKAKPALRTIEEVVFFCSRGGEEFEHDADEKLVEGLNRAVKTRRSLVRRRRLERQIVSLANDLCEEAEEWLAADAREQVAVRAHLKGGKVECEFRRYQCACDGPHCSWRKRQKWTGDLEVETDEPVTVLTLPLPTPEDEHAHALTALQDDVLAFVKRVDLPGYDRSSEPAPIAQ